MSEEDFSKDLAAFATALKNPEMRKALMEMGRGLEELGKTTDEEHQYYKSLNVFNKLLEPLRVPLSLLMAHIEAGLGPAIAKATEVMIDLFTRPGVVATFQGIGTVIGAIFGFLADIIEIVVKLTKPQENPLADYILHGHHFIFVD